MIARLFPAARLHERADPAERVLGVATLPGDSDALARLLVDDPAPEVRAAAAARCTRLDALASAWRTEADAGVRAALAPALAEVIAHGPDDAAATACLASEPCTDPIRADVAKRTRAVDRGLAAVTALHDEAALVDVALAADFADVRLAAAERVHSPEALRRLAEAARDKDRGVARIARTRLDALADSAAQALEADDILARLEALADAPGPIVSAVVELDRRWAALRLADDAPRRARWEQARAMVQARFDRENEAQRARLRFERSVGEVVAASTAPGDDAAIAALRERIAALRAQADAYGEATAHARLDEALQRLERRGAELHDSAAAEALVIEAEQLAASDAIDDGGLPARWESLPRSVRSPALTRRFEAALLLVTQRRVARAQAAEQEASAARHDVHRLLHAAEQALAAGQLHAARAAADELRARRVHADRLPKPTLQRLGRLVQQLAELERWESFGQHNARVQLCEQAEALAAAALPPQQLAGEVAKLRDAWKALDTQSPGVPKGLWERFDRACEKAYAPAARHFAEVAAQRKEARKRREAFVAEAAERASALLAQEPRDWRAIEHWLRDTDRTWHGSELGSVDAKAWKACDAKFKAAVTPLREALGEARRAAKAARQALIDEATALSAGKERDAPARVKALQAQWQAQAKAIALEQRDERALWERFRGACDAVFQARQAQRERVDAAKHEGRRALDAIVAEMDALAKDAEGGDEGDVRQRLRALEERWRKALPARDPALRPLEARFAGAKSSVDAALAARRRTREQAVWQTLAQKERLCEEADAHVAAGDRALDANALRERWTALPSLPAAWEKKLLARRDAALQAADDAATTAEHAGRMRARAPARAELLLKLELAHGLPSPAALAQQRLALQVAQLKARFGHADGTAEGPGDLAVDWCAEPGIASPEDRARFERIASALAVGVRR